MSVITNLQMFELLQEVKQQNNTIKTDVQAIKEDLSRDKERIRELADKVSELERENSTLQKRIQGLEESSKKNSIIIFGLAEETEDSSSLKEEILSLFNNTLSIEVSLQDIDNLYRTRKRGDTARPVIVRFVRFSDKQIVLRSTHKLKGTSLSITNDITLQQQQEQKTLYKFFKLAKNKGHLAKIIRNKLIVNEEVLSVHDLLEADEISFSEFFINKKQFVRNNSASVTPSRSNGDKQNSPAKTQQPATSQPHQRKNIKSKEKEEIEVNQSPTKARIITRTAKGRTNSTSQKESREHKKGG